VMKCQGGLHLSTDSDRLIQGIYKLVGSKVIITLTVGFIGKSGIVSETSNRICDIHLPIGQHCSCSSGRDIPGHLDSLSGVQAVCQLSTEYHRHTSQAELAFRYPSPSGQRA
jgi:hypothetical protein